MEQEKDMTVTNARPEKKKKKVWLFLLFFLLLAIIALLAALVLKKPEEPQQGMREANAMIGQFEGKTLEEIEEELNRVVERGLFNISINPDIILNTGADEADVRIENVPGNQYLMRVTITQDDTGEVLYTTGLIEPNYHVQKITFDKVLPKGTYPATAVFTAYDMETEAEAGTAAAKITITVKN